MAPLPTDLRRALERAVIAARDTAEAGAGNALAVLGVEEDRAPDVLSPTDRALRVQLRARARSLGNGLFFDGIPELREEIAYAAWHRMLFARFLAENGLLVEPASGVPVSLDDVAELAREQREADPWVLAARYAAEMLPGIFGTADPTTRVVFAPDDRLQLEAILKALPAELFAADDALGWVYQFWQSRRKDEVNASGRKIGGADLAPVTQLFTEHYMVRFLLENSLGAWWAGRHPDSPLLREWEYLRVRDDGTPAAGTFEGWPERASEITVMDPCMGSGHFLVAAADMLRKMRVEEEHIGPAAAAEAVLADNLYGLELDPRCTQLAAFALAFDGWKAVGGYCPLPVPNIACSGIAVKGQLDDWRRLAGSDEKLRGGLERLYALFQDAPELGSLIDPRSAAGEGLWAVDPDALLAALERALASENNDPAAAVFGADAEGTAKAARLLARRYWLVATNPPFLGRGKQAEALATFLDRTHPELAPDLATAMLGRCALPSFLHGGGVTAFVLPQNCLTQLTHRRFREWLLARECLRVVAALGARGFSTPMWEFGVALVITSSGDSPGTFVGIDVGGERSPDAKSIALRQRSLAELSQSEQSDNPDSAIRLALPARAALLASVASAYQGLSTGDNSRHLRLFSEVTDLRKTWAVCNAPPDGLRPFSGYELAVSTDVIRGRTAGAAVRGREAWGKRGVAVARVGSLATSLYQGAYFTNIVPVIVPRDPNHIASLWAFCSSGAFAKAVRQLFKGLSVDNGYMTKVPFDLEHWTQVAAEQYPNGLPEPHSEDPTQWLFKGNIVGSEAPLQVAVARLLGYRWPDQEPDPLDALADPDGIVCLPAVGEAPAAERLEKLLAAAYGSDWSATKRAELLAGTGGKATTLEAWLRDEFFEQHARLFHNRPFIWQVWDTRRTDGFSALLHYHRLDRPTLEKLTYAHLGDWVERQRADAKAGEPGADGRLRAAQALQAKLGAILEGEPPYDIYVRWKPLAAQPLGWQPDLDDGVRLNIRPFVTAGVLRAKFTINWNKDRGTDPDGSERLNDCHYTLAEKRTAREARA